MSTFTSRSLVVRVEWRERARTDISYATFAIASAALLPPGKYVENLLEYFRAHPGIDAESVQACMICQ